MKNREYRNTKYGYGGRKKGSKFNTAESSGAEEKGSSFKRNFKVSSNWNIYFCYILILYVNVFEICKEKNDLEIQNLIYLIFSTLWSSWFKETCLINLSQKLDLY